MGPRQQGAARARRAADVGLREAAMHAVHDRGTAKRKELTLSFDPDLDFDLNLDVCLYGQTGSHASRGGCFLAR